MDFFKSEDNFTRKVQSIIRQIPRGKVATYGQIAFLAGHPRSTRRVVWILHACSEKEKLPWHRVINQKGTISLRPGSGYETQKDMLLREGIIFDQSDRIDLDRFLWDPDAFRGF